ncbi:MAG TPA: hypothetical protein PKW56_04215 [Clostridiales bacterium]|nr:hypothetical protein [Clostridiales bacterium]
MDKKEPDYKAFIPIGFSFFAIGVVFLKKSPGIGLAFIGLGISWIAIGYKKSKTKKGDSHT